MLHITKQDQNIMIISDNNYFAIIIGLIFFIMGFLIIFSPGIFTNNPPAFFGVICSGIGIFVILVAKVTSITIDKDMGKLSLNLKSILKNEIKEFPIDSISELELRPTYDSNNHGGRTFHSYLIFRDQSEVVLDLYTTTISSSLNTRPDSQISLGTQIANFMGVPFKERRPPTIQETLNTITQSIDSKSQQPPVA